MHHRHGEAPMSELRHAEFHLSIRVNTCTNRSLSACTPQSDAYVVLSLPFCCGHRCCGQRTYGNGEAMRCASAAGSVSKFAQHAGALAQPARKDPHRMPGLLLCRQQLTGGNAEASSRWFQLHNQQHGQQNCVKGDVTGGGARCRYRTSDRQDSLVIQCGACLSSHRTSSH